MYRAYGGVRRGLVCHSLRDGRSEDRRRILRISYALQQTIAIVMYLPRANLPISPAPLIDCDDLLVLRTVPFAVFIAHSTPLLVAAFVIGGLKEFGEPARKSFIVDHVPPPSGAGCWDILHNPQSHHRPWGLLGGILWGISSELLFLTSLGLGIVGLGPFL